MSAMTPEQLAALNAAAQPVQTAQPMQPAQVPAINPAQIAQTPVIDPTAAPAPAPAGGAMQGTGISPAMSLGIQTAMAGLPAQAMGRYMPAINFGIGQRLMRQNSRP